MDTITIVSKDGEEIKISKNIADMSEVWRITLDPIRGFKESKTGIISVDLDMDDVQGLIEFLQASDDDRMRLLDLFGIDNILELYDNADQYQIRDITEYIENAIPNLFTFYEQIYMLDRVSKLYFDLPITDRLYELIVPFGYKLIDYVYTNNKIELLKILFKDNPSDIVSKKLYIHSRFGPDKSLTPLYYFIDKNADIDLIKTIIEAGADLNEPSFPSTQTDEKRYSISKAINKDRKDVVELLIKHNADLSLEDSGDSGDFGSIPIVYNAVRRGNKDIVRMLINAGANVDIAYYDRYERKEIKPIDISPNEEITSLLIGAIDKPLVICEEYTKTKLRKLASLAYIRGRTKMTSEELCDELNKLILRNEIELTEENGIRWIK